MRKKYINPANKVHQLETIRMVAETAPASGGEQTEPGIESESRDASVNGEKSGSTNIWANEW